MRLVLAILFLLIAMSAGAQVSDSCKTRWYTSQFKQPTTDTVLIDPGWSQFRLNGNPWKNDFKNDTASNAFFDFGPFDGDRHYLSKWTNVPYIETAPSYIRIPELPNDTVESVLVRIKVSSTIYTYMEEVTAIYSQEDYVYDANTSNLAYYMPRHGVRKTLLKVLDKKGNEIKLPVHYELYAKSDL